MYTQLPAAYRCALAQNVDMGRWSKDGILFMVEHHPELLGVMMDEKRPLAHFLAIDPKGQRLLKRLACTVPLDEHGNTALLTWCIAAFNWKSGSVSLSSSGLPSSTLHYLPDSHEHALESLMGLLELGVEPGHANPQGLRAWEQAMGEEDVFIWSGMRRAHQDARALRLLMLQSWLQSSHLQGATAAASQSVRITRL